MTTNLSRSPRQRRRAEPAGGQPRLYRDLFKRFADILLVAVSVPIAIPLILICIAIVATDGANPFFVQQRVGRNGRFFKILKLRTMVPDAEAKLAEHLAGDDNAAAEWDRTQKLRSDPRITAVGRFLRKTSLDELPQIWNVLIGDMSLVGPRPMLPSQMALYPGTLYFTLRPGVTGPWQISSRNEAEFASRARYDTQYATEVSLFGDLRILARTVIVVIKGTGY